MVFTLRQIEQEDNFSQHLCLDALREAIPVAQIEAVLAEYGPKQTRRRRLTPRAVMWLIICMHLFSRSSLAHVFGHLARGLRLIWPDPLYQLPTDAALSYRRYQLGAKPLVALFHAICQPLATPQTQGAFLFGLRLMAILRRMRERLAGIKITVARARFLNCKESTWSNVEPMPSWTWGSGQSIRVSVLAACDSCVAFMLGCC